MFDCRRQIYFFLILFPFICFNASANEWVRMCLHFTWAPYEDNSNEIEQQITCDLNQLMSDSYLDSQWKCKQEPYLPAERSDFDASDSGFWNEFMTYFSSYEISANSGLGELLARYVGVLEIENTPTLYILQFANKPLSPYRSYLIKTKNRGAFTLTVDNSYYGGCFFPQDP